MPEITETKEVLSPLPVKENVKIEDWDGDAKARRKAEKIKRKKEKQAQKRFTKKRFRWKRWLVLLIIAGLVGYGMYTNQVKKNAPTPVTTLALTKGDLESSLSLSGTVHSAEESQVYAKINGMLEAVNVKVGDMVEAGDLLAQIDTSDLQIDIAKQQAAINLQQKKNEMSMSTTEQELANKKVDIAANLNQDLLSAKSRMDSAQAELNAARRDFNDSKDKWELADNLYKKIGKDLDNALTKQKNASVAYEKDKSEENRLALEAANEDFETANDAYNDFDTEYGGEMSLEARRYREARTAYQNALDSKRAVENSIDRNLESMQTDIATTELSSDMTLERLTLQKLQKDVADSSIYAPTSGMVTAVYAKEGAPASGLLFIIEDTENLVVKTSLKEYEVTSVKEGMEATVKSDATGEKEFLGIVEKIYPTAAKNAQGETESSGSVDFQTDVTLMERDDLRVGMNVRIGLVTASKSNVWFVPFDAVTTSPDGSGDIIYTLEKDEEGFDRVKAVPVTVGMETDFSAEITGESLTEGMPIIVDPTMVQVGMKVIDPALAAEAAMAAVASGEAASGETSSVENSSEEAGEASSVETSSEEAGETSSEEAGEASSASSVG